LFRRHRTARQPADDFSEACRDEHRSSFFARVRQDVSYAARMMRRSPGFASVAVLSLAVGIGACTAIAGVVDNLLFRPPPFAHVDRIVCLFDTHPTQIPPDADVPPSPGNMLDWRERARSFDDMVAWRNWYYSFTDMKGSGDRVESIRGVRVSPTFFEMLGVCAELGRIFRGDESKPGRDRIVVLSHAFWSRRFGGDPSIVGESVLVDDRPVTVVGVRANCGHPARPGARRRPDDRWSSRSSRCPSCCSWARRS